MNLMFVPKPLFTSDMTAEGYYLTYQQGNAILEAAKSNPLDGAMNSPFISFINEVGLEALTLNKIIFVPVTTILMMTDLDRECHVEPGKIAFIMDKKIDLSDMLLERVRRYVNMGFKIAFRGFENLSALWQYLPFANYVFCTYSDGKLQAQQKLLKTEYPHIQMVVADIEAKPVFDRIKYLGYDLFDGPFYKVHIPASNRYEALSPLKVNYVQLLNIVNQNDFDFSVFTRVIRQDTALAIQFMRLVNSVSKNHAEIKNINQAAAMLGQREIKKWVATAVSNALCADKPSEITRLSLSRAKFCENMAKYFNMAILQDNLFLLGLLSVLDVILELPMEAALNLVFVPEQIRRALLGNQSEYRHVLDFVLCYEQGDWREVSRQSLMQSIPIDGIYDAYVDAILWYSSLINMPAPEGNVL